MMNRSQTCNFESIRWDSISFNELEIILQLCSDCDHLLVNSVLRNKLTPLCLACKFNREDLVTVLLYHGADPNKQSQHLDKAPLHFACDHRSGNLGIVRKLIDAQVNLNALDEDGNTALHLACSEENTATVELLLDSAATVDLQDKDGETPLMRACLAHNIELVELLLTRGSNPNVCEGQALESVVRSQANQDKALSVIHLLVDKGADIHQGPFLVYACQQENVEMMEILHHYGADLEKASVLGVTPLQTACFTFPSNLAPLRLLLKWGALVNAYSVTSKTALHVACKSLHLEKISLLLSYGADVNAFDRQQNSPLMSAVNAAPLYPRSHWSERVVPVVSLLLCAGAVVTSRCIESLLNAVTDVPHQLLTEVYSQTRQAKSLQSLCRICIRGSLQPVIDDNIDTLPLPVPIISYLKFSDVLQKYEKG